MIRTAAARTAALVTVTAAIAAGALLLAGPAFADADPGADATTPETTTSYTATSETATSETAESAAFPVACTLLPLELAQETIDNRNELELASDSGGVECLYQPVDRSGDHQVDLDISASTADSLEKARFAYSSPGVVVADAPEFGDGAFTALNNEIDAIVVCAKDGVQYDVEVIAPDTEFARTQVATLAQRYCGEPTTADTTTTDDTTTDATDATDATTDVTGEDAAVEDVDAELAS